MAAYEAKSIVSTGMLSGGYNECSCKVMYFDLLDNLVNFTKKIYQFEAIYLPCEFAFLVYFSLFPLR